MGSDTCFLTPKGGKANNSCLVILATFFCRPHQSSYNISDSVSIMMFFDKLLTGRFWGDKNTWVLDKWENFLVLFLGNILFLNIQKNCWMNNSHIVEVKQNDFSSRLGIIIIIVELRLWWDMNGSYWNKYWYLILFCDSCCQIYWTRVLI